MTFSTMYSVLTGPGQSETMATLKFWKKINIFLGLPGRGSEPRIFSFIHSLSGTLPLSISSFADSAKAGEILKYFRVSNLRMLEQ